MIRLWFNRVDLIPSYNNEIQIYSMEEESIVTHSNQVTAKNKKDKI